MSLVNMSSGSFETSRSISGTTAGETRRLEYGTTAGQRREAERGVEERKRERKRNRERKNSECDRNTTDYTQREMQLTRRGKKK